MGKHLRHADSAPSCRSLTLPVSHLFLCFIGILTRISTFGNTTQNTNITTGRHRHQTLRTGVRVALMRFSSSRRRTRRNCRLCADGSLSSASLQHLYASHAHRPWCVFVSFSFTFVSLSEVLVLLPSFLPFYRRTTRTHRQAAFAEVPVARQFDVSKEVAILGVSLFVLGLGLGPLVAGPMSEIYGRNVVYRVSFTLFFLFMFPVAFAPDICMCFLSVGCFSGFPAAPQGPQMGCCIQFSSKVLP